jgi:hypothetical protein
MSSSGIDADFDFKCVKATTEQRMLWQTRSTPAKEAPNSGLQRLGKDSVAICEIVIGWSATII